MLLNATNAASDMAQLIQRLLYAKTDDEGSDDVVDDDDDKGSDDEDDEEEDKGTDDEDDEDEEEEDEEEKEPDRKSRKQVRAARAAEKRAKRQLATAQKKLKDFEKKTKKANLTEVEQLRQSLADSEKQREKAEEATTKLSVRNKILAVASREGFTDPEDVIAYISLKGLEDEEDLDDVIEELKEEKPYLLSVNAQGNDNAEDTPGKTTGRSGSGKKIKKSKTEGRADDAKKRAALIKQYDEAKRRGDSQTMRIVWARAGKFATKEQRLGTKRTGLFEYEEPLEAEE